jgi:hypothetical protein
LEAGPALAGAAWMIWREKAGEVFEHRWWVLGVLTGALGYRKRDSCYCGHGTLWTLTVGRGGNYRRNFRAKGAKPKT